VPKGQRNDALFRMACNLFREGHQADHVGTMVVALNEADCKPPLPAAEVASIVKSAQQQVEEGKKGTYPYAVRQGRIEHIRQTKDGEVAVRLCNFIACIVEQVVADDGVERRITFALEGNLANGPALPRTEVPAADFAGMAWVVPSWGTRAVVYAGMGIRDHLRAAIQVISGDVPQRIVFEHTGWREVEDQWVFLHAGGGIGAQGAVPAVEVQLPDGLSLYHLPDPPSGEQLREAVLASVRVLDLAPHAVTAPLLGAVYRSVLRSGDFAVHLAGPTGHGKSELAALAQQHFGAGMDARHLPGSWSSTANSLEGLAFHVKDALLVVDDFAPHGTMADVARMHKEADRLLRAQGNRSGRGRCRPDGSLRPAKPPRGLILSTGEDIPRGQSLRARQLILELAPGDVHWDKLTCAQKDAMSGKYAAALAAYVQWLAPRISTIRQELAQKTAALRKELRTVGQHARTPGIVADLLFGWLRFLDFALECGAITIVGYAGLRGRVRKALLEVAARQAAHLECAEPAGQFLRLLAAAVAAGRAHVADPNGGMPPGSPGSWGWEEDPRPDCLPRPRGNKVGWVQGPHLFLEPDASYAAAQELARDQGDALTVSAHTLRKRLHERKYLLSTEVGKLTNRRKLEGQVRSVLHLHASCLSAQKPGDSGDSGGSPKKHAKNARSCPPVSENGAQNRGAKPGAESPSPDPGADSPPVSSPGSAPGFQASGEKGGAEKPHISRGKQGVPPKPPVPPVSGGIDAALVEKLARFHEEYLARKGRRGTEES
jgi:hypothetical protein